MNKKSLAGSVLLLQQNPLEQSIVWNKLFFVTNVVKNLKRATRLHGILMLVRVDDGQLLDGDACSNWDLTVSNSDMEKLLNDETDINNEVVDRVFNKSIDKILSIFNDKSKAEFEVTIKDKFVGKTLEFSTSKNDEMLAHIIDIPTTKVDDKGQYVVSMEVRTTQGGVLFKKYSIVDTTVTVPLINLCR